MDDPSESDVQADESGRRAELRRFLRARRDALRPQDVGLAGGGRRRTRGLRREEVAELAAVSVAWYTLFEMGRDIRVSKKTVSAVARALHLDAHEHLYLRVLSGIETRCGPDEALEPSPYARSLVESYPSSPAFIFDRAWDVVAWNPLFACTLGYPDHERHRGANNLIWRAFTPPIRAMLAGDWEVIVRRMVASLRTNYAWKVGDSRFESLLELLRTFPEFSEIWSDFEITPWSPIEQFFEHPRVGRIDFASVTTVLVDTPSLTLAVMVPIPGTDSAAKYAALATDLLHGPTR
jgi:PAS domain-containing protein